jgi:hypothetical protein
MRSSVQTAVSVAVLALVLAGCGGSNKTVSGTGYHLTLPAHWHQVTRSVPAGVDAVYTRDGKTALLTIRSEARVPVKGYVPLAHRILVTKAGPVFYFSYTQKSGGRLTSIILVPGHGKSFILDAVSNPDSKAATRDIASIFHTFVPR